MSDDYALTVKVDNNTVKKTNLDGSYVYYVDGTATSADVWALASNANYRVEITGKDGISGNNNTNPTLGATVTTDLEDTINSNFTEVTITVKSDDITNTSTAEYKLYIYKKSNNANIKSVTANPNDSENKDTDTTADDSVNLGGNIYNAYHVYVPKSTTSGYTVFDLAIELEDVNAAVTSIDNAPFANTNGGTAKATFTKLTADYDFDGDGTNDSFAIPVTVTSQSGGTKDYYIIATPTDMDMELTVEYDDEKIAKEEDKNEYIVYVPTTSNTATIYLTSINGNIAEVRNTTNANNIITVDSPDRTLYRLQVSNLSDLTESNPYTYEVDVAKCRPTLSGTETPPESDGR